MRDDGQLYRSLFHLCDLTENLNETLNPGRVKEPWKGRRILSGLKTNISGSKDDPGGFIKIWNWIEISGYAFTFLL
jgi:hypothetical protein